MLFHIKHNYFDSRRRLLERMEELVPKNVGVQLNIVTAMISIQIAFFLMRTNRGSSIYTKRWY